MKKLLFILSLASIATTVLANPAFAEPYTFKGYKGTYSINDGAYRGCLFSGGCITLSRKYLIPCVSPEPDACEVISWKKGEYVYSIHDQNVYVSKNGRMVFQDRGKY
jgi:hypothetical protein